ncbi:hypothetical protein STCU_03842 [Strigomonas culicis]|uniref:Uncharacterized protein n=1 Tax=Strigomonas culicis TaxID=28005 RepID=S9VUL4_9TRYP|nr:hypothetical protein STCU_03842 [Strigomonas culicis]|eukprot:EPY30861.1 hypothetical protein STCU_03842 [Strigomonas culicis]
MQRREIMVWDPRNMKTAIHTTCTDQSSAAPMPVFDEDLNLLSVASRGEGRVRNYELIGGALVHSFDFSSSESVKGYCSFPKRSLNVKECEISRCYVLGQRKLFSARMLLPRKMAAEEFQENVYPPTFADKPAISAKDYFDSKKNARPLEVNMKYLFDGSAPPTAATSAKEHVKNTAPAVSAPSREGSQETPRARKGEAHVHSGWPCPRGSVDAQRSRCQEACDAAELMREAGESKSGVGEVACRNTQERG